MSRLKRLIIEIHHRSCTSGSIAVKLCGIEGIEGGGHAWPGAPGPFFLGRGFHGLRGA
jgi:hypothetical protein